MLWAKAGRQWRLSGLDSRPYSGVTAVIFGTTAPPSETLHRMVLCGGGKAVVVHDIDSPLLSSLKRVGIGRRKVDKRKLEHLSTNRETDDEAISIHDETTRRDESMQIGSISVKDITAIIAAPSSSSNQQDQQQLLSLLSAAAVKVPFQHPAHLLDALSSDPPYTGSTDRPTLLQKLQQRAFVPMIV
jgi:hypothetical protein